MKVRIAGLLLLAATGCFYDHHYDLHEDRYVSDGGPMSQFVASLEDSATDLQVQGRGGEDVQVHGVISGRSHSDIAAAWLTLDRNQDREELLFRSTDERYSNLDRAEILLPSGSDLNLSTGSGNVQVRSMQGSVRAGSGSGDLDVETSGPVALDTGSGNVHAWGSSGSASTGSGDVFFVVSEGATGALRLHTGSGDVVVNIPRDLGVDIQASTDSGRIRVDAGGVHVDQDGSALVRLGGGGLAITVDTGSGGVTIKE